MFFSGGCLKMKKLSLFSLAWPIFVETALFMLLGFIDVFILSRYDDIAASAVNTANQSVSIITIVFSVISGASAVLISQYLGAGKKENASRIAAISITFNFVIGVVISAVLLIFSRSILSFIGADGTVMEYASQYLSIVGGSIFLQALLSAAAVIIRNHGLTKVTMFMSLGMNIFNALFDMILVLGLFGFPRLGVAGAAIATALCRSVGAAVIMVYLFRRVEKPSIFRLMHPFPVKDIIDMMKIGVPSAMETFLYNLSQLVITSIVLKYLTETELVTKTYVQNITMFFYIFAVAIGQASQIITGHYVGAKKYAHAYREGLKAYYSALIFAAVMSTAGILFRYPLMGIFTKDEAVISLGAGILMINIFLELGRTTNLVMIASLRGAGDVLFPTMCAVFSNWMISVLCSYIFAVVLGMGIYGLWIAIIGDELVRGILMLLRWKSGKWKSKGVVRTENKKTSQSLKLTGQDKYAVQK